MLSENLLHIRQDLRKTAAKIEQTSLDAPKPITNELRKVQKNIKESIDTLLTLHGQARMHEAQRRDQ